MKPLVSLLCLFFFYHCNAQSKKAEVSISFDPGHPANSFIPSAIIGAAFDGHEEGDIKRILTPDNIVAMHSVGLKPLSYRLRTELGCETWHWNPQGTWSEKGKAQGYWISDSVSETPITISNGYKLPRRGNTGDQANDDGYSRLDDGDTSSFWKSNPYLDEYFTNESNSLHPQWAIIDLGVLTDVNAIKINWGNPYAASFTVDYALDIGSDYFEPFRPQLWHSFLFNQFDDTGLNNRIFKVANKPVKVRFVRISMTKSVYSRPQQPSDIRDKLGFAIREIQIGVVDNQQHFHDKVHHAANHASQSIAYTSSTDPWHRASDIDIQTEQAGIDLYFNSGLTNQESSMIPSGLLYDTPENMENFFRYLKNKNYPVSEIEMGEEPEGQLISPVDYGAFYYQWGNMIRKIMPAVHLGGPGFATLAFDKDDDYTFSESRWTAVFLDYLKKRNSLTLFNFFSFEWYPFDEPCGSTSSQLMEAPTMLSTAIENLVNAHLPKGTPVYLTEYGYSAFAGKAEVGIEGALMYADILGKFLELGGNKNFLYGYEPTFLESSDNCGFGNNMLLGMDKNGKIQYKVAAYYGTQMLTQQWMQSADSMIEIYPATSNIVNTDSRQIVSAYTARLADHWSVLLINKDPKRSFDVQVTAKNLATGKSKGLLFSQGTQYSSKQYHWLANGRDGHPSLNLPPVKLELNNSKYIILPPFSMTVVHSID